MTNLRVAIVTGGASGLGRALCSELAREGILVVIADLNEEAAKQVADELKSGGSAAESAKLDVSSRVEVEQLIDSVVARHGRLDYMFNNAGFAIAGDTIEMSPEQWERIIAVNVEGCIWGTMAAYRVMARQKFGHIVNTASMAGLSPLPLSTPYSMTKHAVVGLTRSLRPEAAWYGVKMSVACPGFIKTSLFDNGVGLGTMPFKTTTSIGSRLAMPVDRAAKLLLKGVRRNQDIIVFPWHGLAMYWMQCFAKWLGRIIARRAIRDFHRKRIATELEKQTSTGEDHK